MSTPDRMSVVPVRELTLTAAAISCEHCRGTIETGLAGSDGVIRVAVDVPTKAIRVEYDETLTDEDALEAELDKLGYPVQVTH